MQVAQLFKVKPAVLITLGVIAWVIGTWQGYNSPASFTVLPTGIAVFLTTLTVFAFSFLFFGFPAPVILFFAGVSAGETYAAAPVITAKLAASNAAFLVAAYAAILLGNALYEDMIGASNFKKAGRASMIALAAALLIAAIADTIII